MSRLTLIIAGSIALIGIAASLLIQQANRATLQEKAAALQEHAQQIARLAAENERLSNSVARAANPQALPPEQVRELLRLRGQISQLRQAPREQAQLQAANQQLRAALADREQQLAAARRAPNFWPKDQLAFAGYAQPEATLKTALWAMNNGDIKALIACVDAGPEANAQLRNLPEAGLAAASKQAVESLFPSVGFHILEKQSNASDEVTLKLSYDGEGKARKFVLKRSGNEWKLKQLQYAGQEE